MNTRLVNPALMWIIVLLGVIPILARVPQTPLIPPNPITPYLIFPAFIIWLVLFTSAVYFHRQAAFSAASIKRIVREGPYKIFNHPIYIADIILAWSVFLRYPGTHVLIAVAWLTLVLMVWMKLEEKALKERFKTY